MASKHVRSASLVITPTLLAGAAAGTGDGERLTVENGLDCLAGGSGVLLRAAGLAGACGSGVPRLLATDENGFTLVVPVPAEPLVVCPVRTTAVPVLPRVDAVPARITAVPAGLTGAALAAGLSEVDTRTVPVLPPPNSPAKKPPALGFSSSSSLSSSLTGARDLTGAAGAFLGAALGAALGGA